MDPINESHKSTNKQTIYHVIHCQMPWSKINVSNCNRFFILHHINVSITFCGSGTFRSLVFSLLRAKVPTGNIRSLERKFPGTFIAWSKCSWEHSFRGAIYWGVGMLIEDRKIETRYKFEYSKLSFQTRNSISLFVFLRKPLHKQLRPGISFLRKWPDAA